MNKPGYHPSHRTSLNPVLVSVAMLPPTCVVVPTYWTRFGGESRPGDALYDHPTALGGSTTLPALLDSLDKLDSSSFYLLVIVAVTGEDVAAQAEQEVRRLVRGYEQLRSLVFGPSHLSWLRNVLDGRGENESASSLDLRTYPRIRNLQLAIPHALHTNAIVAVDDDEIVTDPLFLEKATEPLGKELDGRRVDGLSGHYLQENGSIMLQVDPDKAASSNLFDRKATIMNAATERLEKESGNIVATPFCFGGNMEFTADLAAAVGFDPGITRGEDIDYLINARMEGKTFFLRKDLHILHCPPKGGSYKDASISKLTQDVVRFIYEREKLVVSQTEPELHPLTAAELMPYPGEFLDRDIEDEAVDALEQAGYSGNARAFVQEARSGARARVDAYLDFRRQWPALMARLHDDSRIFDYLAGQIHGL